jgi:sigma-B regulation protein RsbU (phosphoserine phosphatase)
VQLSAGQWIVCYTDGIIEAMNAQEEMFGEDGLADACMCWGSQPIAQMVKRLFHELDRFIAGAPQRDDQAMLAMEVTEEA